MKQLYTSWTTRAQFLVRAAILFFATATRRTLGPTHPSTEWVLWDMYPGMKRYHEAEVCNAWWAISPCPPHTFMVWCLLPGQPHLLPCDVNNEFIKMPWWTLNLNVSKGFSISSVKFYEPGIMSSLPSRVYYFMDYMKTISKKSSVKSQYNYQLTNTTILYRMET